ncbi:MAG: hypothetical protein A3G41_00225, partial [Elusimicrobia bacterium RIFCSPLOWO2_12_FULL_59_9]
MSKRIFDLFFSTLGILFFLPLFVAIATWIKLESEGPVFYRGLRVGLNGEPFQIFKFRTMVSNAEKLGGPSTALDDRRITRAGAIFRKYKLDELPQLLSVWKGDMSFVGPRPEVRQYVDLYSDEEKQILTVRPGITDYSSIKFHNEGEILAGSADPEKDYLEKIRPAKLRLQLEYVRDHSVWGDVKI